MRPSILAGLLAAAALAPPLDGQTIDTLAVESHARFLAHDLLEGRGPASRGERIAALYIESQLRRSGLRPLGSDGYLLPVPLTAVHVQDDRAAAHIYAEGADHTLRSPDFYHPGGSGSAFRDFAGELVFAGSAAHALPVLERSEEIAGRVVVLTPPWSGIEEAESELLRRGAAGSVQLIPHAGFYERLRTVRGPTRYHLPDGVNDPANQGALPTVVGGPAMIAALGLEEEVAARAPQADVRPLGSSFRLELPFTTEVRTGYNVGALVPGSDPALREELVMYVAHYDHVGFGEPTGGDSIWNGFIDNAAGTAMLLEIASAMAADPPARSVAFLFVTAEEQGLLGSNWFVHTPPLALERIHAVLNIDGGAPPAPPTGWGLVGADASPVGERARAVIEGHGWSVRAVAAGPQSDHWPFHLAGVPTIMLFPGEELEGLSEGEAQALRDRWLRPHTPDDEWSADFPMSGLGRYATLAVAIGRALAGMP